MDRQNCIFCHNQPKTVNKFQPVQLEQCGHLACYFCIIGYFIATKDAAGVAECPECFYLFDSSNLHSISLPEESTLTIEQLSFGDFQSDRHQF